MKRNEKIISNLIRSIDENVTLYIAAIFVEQATYVFCLNIVLAYVMQDTINSAVEGNADLIFSRMKLLAIATIFAIVVIPISQYISNRKVRKIISSIRFCIFNKTTFLKMSVSDELHSGDIISTFSNDIIAIESLFFLHLKNFLNACLVGPVSIFVLTRLDWRLGGAVLFLGVVTIIFNWRQGKKMRSISEKNQKSLSNMNVSIVENINRITELKMLNMKDVMLRTFREKNDEYSMNSSKRVRLHSFVTSFGKMFFFFKQMTVITIGILLFFIGKIEIGTVIASTYLLSSADYMFENFGKIYIEVQKTLASGKRILDFLLLPQEDVNKKNVVQQSSHVIKEDTICPETHEIIKVKNIYYRYKEDQQDIIKGVSFTVNEGEFVAVVGASGCGKSTLLKLLLGLYPIREGEVYVKGKTFTNLSIKEIRELSSYVPQDSYLFDGTIRDNIMLGNINATHSQMVRTAQMTRFHDYILAFANGYETEIGERSNRISGGQRQRIAIVRALLKKTSILLLDEATASLDKKTEKEIIETLVALKNKATTILVTHKLENIIHCDKIIVLKEGQVIDFGTYNELIQSSSYFNYLHTERSE